MTRRICSIPRCASPVTARGWCNKHYRRWQRSGDPLTAAWERGDPDANFWAKVDRRGPAECWPWTGYISEDGYGRFIFDGGSLSHRFSYIRAFGPIAERSDVDHMCHNVDGSCENGPDCLHRRCVNPMHLRVIPADRHRGMVVRPGQRGKPRGAQQRAKTHCPRGHEYTPENTYVDKRGARNCRECRRGPSTPEEKAAARARYHRRKQQK